jgi:GT2 family glycosyltransferase
VIYFLTINYYSTKLITKLISSIQFSRDIPHKTIIINNSPEDASIHLLKNEAIFIKEAGTNLGFGKACNLGLSWIYAQDTQAIVWIVNPDAYLLKTSVDKVSLFFETYPELSIVGTIIYTPNAKVWFAGGCFVRKTGTILAQKFLTNPDADYSLCDWVSGCSLLINLRNFPDCPKFDPAYFLYYEDFDFCRRYASLGHLIGVTKHLSVIHQPSAITNRNMFKKMKYSTYSYLLTIEKYTNRIVLLLRLTRLISHAFILMLVKPKVGFGKLYGVLLYLRRSLPFC